MQRVNNQLEILFPGDRVRHAGGERFVVAKSQAAMADLEWLHEPGVIYVLNFQGMRMPIDRWTLSLE